MCHEKRLHWEILICVSGLQQEGMSSGGKFVLEKFSGLDSPSIFDEEPNCYEKALEESTDECVTKEKVPMLKFCLNYSPKKSVGCISSTMNVKMLAGNCEVATTKQEYQSIRKGIQLRGKGEIFSLLQIRWPPQTICLPNHYNSSDLQP